MKTRPHIPRQMSSVLKEKIRKIFKGTKRLIGMKRGKMLQNEQKNRGESRIWEVEKASGIEAWEFPRLHKDTGRWTDKKIKYLIVKLTKK